MKFWFFLVLPSIVCFYFGEELETLINSESLEFKEVFKTQLVPALEKWKAFTTMKGKNGFLSPACSICKEATPAILKIAKQNVSQETLLKIAIFVCNLVQISSKRICEKIVWNQGPTVITVLKNAIVGENEICSGIGACDRLDHEPWIVSFPKPKPTRLSFKSDIEKGQESQILNIGLLSDWHLDLQYTAGLEAQCGEPLCCRPPNPIGQIRPAGKWGDFNCDVPVALAENMLQTMIETEPEMAFVMVCGDIPPHDVWDITKESVIESEFQTAELFKKYLQIPVFFTIGNHESAPANSFPFKSVTEYSIKWLYESLANQWSSWVSEENLKIFRQSGYYSTRIDGYKNLKIISLNTQFCYYFNFWLFMRYFQNDPDNMLHWLIEELQQSEDLGEKVYIIGHVPPGEGDCATRWARYYYEIVNRYEFTIAGQFFGHTHSDSFEIFYEDKQRRNPSSVAFITPAVTTYEQMNPSFRILQVNLANWEVMNIKTYITDIKEANASGTPKWKLEYDFKEAYQLDSLSPKELDNLTFRLEADNELFMKMWAFSHKMANVPRCDKRCKSSFICGLRSGSFRFACPAVASNDFYFTNDFKCF